MTAADRIRMKLHAQLRVRVDRLLNLIGSNATNREIADETYELDQLGQMLDPELAANRLRLDLEEQARQLAGVCVVSGCESDADEETKTEMCKRHSERFNADVSNLLAQGPKR